MNISAAEILRALSWRYAVKTFDPAKNMSDEDLHTILESGRLAPSSVGLEPWKFIVVDDPEVRAKLREASYGQSKVTDAARLIVIAARTDAERLSDELIARTSKAQGKSPEELAPLRQMAEGSISAKPAGVARNGWLAAQTYIALGVMLETASLLGIDAGPMEGFDADKVDGVLGLKEKNLHAATMLALGYRGDDAFAALPKTRRPFDEAVEFVA